MNALFTVHAQSFERMFSAINALRLASQRHRACRIGLVMYEGHRYGITEAIVTALMQGNKAEAARLHKLQARFKAQEDALRLELAAARQALRQAAETARHECAIHKALSFLVEYQEES